MTPHVAVCEERVTCRGDWPSHEHVAVHMCIPLRGISSEVSEIAINRCAGVYEARAIDEHGRDVDISGFGVTIQGCLLALTRNMGPVSFKWLCARAANDGSIRLSLSEGSSELIIRRDFGCWAAIWAQNDGTSGRIARSIRREPLHELLDALSEELRDCSLGSIFERIERTLTVEALTLGWLQRPEPASTND